jgi:hypothetical protein
MKLKKLNRELYQNVITSFGCNALKLRSSQNGTFGTKVTARPVSAAYALHAAMVETARRHKIGCRGHAPAASPARHCAWSEVERRNALRRGVGRESLTRRVWGARLPDCRCNGTRRCRASNPRRVGLGRGAGTLLVVVHGPRKALLGRDATGGRSASLAKRVVQQHTACPIPFSTPIPISPS